MYQGFLSGEWTEFSREMGPQNIAYMFAQFANLRNFEIALRNLKIHFAYFEIVVQF